MSRERGGRRTSCRWANTAASWRDDEAREVAPADTTRGQQANYYKQHYTRYTDGPVTILKHHTPLSSVAKLTRPLSHRPEVLVTPTQDEGKLIAALHSVKPAGDADLATAINVAQVSSTGTRCVFCMPTLYSLQLALKHRQNKNQRQRIIVFVGSPLNATSAALVKVSTDDRILASIMLILCHLVAWQEDEEEQRRD